MNLRITFTTLLFCFTIMSLGATMVDMKKKGAETSGKKLNTYIINKTIEQLSHKGGGTLYFAAGTYLTGAIHLKSNITIELEAGATLLFSDNFDDYLPFVEMRHEGIVMKSFSPFIYARDAENVTIKGEGNIDGNGEKWWNEFNLIMNNLKTNSANNLSKYQLMWFESNDTSKLQKETDKTFERAFFRPPLLQFIRTKNIKISGVKIINSPFWTINPEFCDNISIDGVTINNPPSPNTDGINPESCRNVHISNCHISVGDDCITLKSGTDLQARILNYPNENITITNCTMLSGHGGVVIGSEMSAGVKKVTISNCIFDGTDRGIRIKTMRGRGGVVEDILISNIIMSNIKKEAIVLDMKYAKTELEPFSERTPVFKNLNISNVIVNGVFTPLKVIGLEESAVSDIYIYNVHFNNTEGECVMQNYHNIKMSEVYVNGEIMTVKF